MDCAVGMLKLEVEKQRAETMPQLSSTTSMRRAEGSVSKAEASAGRGAEEEKPGEARGSAEGVGAVARGVEAGVA